MAAKIIDGKALATRLRDEMAEEARGLLHLGVKPGLAVVLVGDDPGSRIYVGNKTKALAAAGFACFDHHLPADTSEDKLLSLVGELNLDPRVDGILVQLPLPVHMNSRARAARYRSHQRRRWLSS